MSPSLGRARLLASDVDRFLGGDSGFAHLSEQTHEEFDGEIRRLLDEAEREALAILQENRATLDALAERVANDETIEGKDLYAVLGKVPVDLARLSRVFGDPSGNGRARTGRSKATRTS
jgi:ATP-dependent Zn protease